MGQEETQVQLPVIKQTVHSAFQPVPPAQLENGGTQLNFLGMDGHLQSWPLTEQQATQLGRQLLAPRVQISDRIPPEVKKAMQNGH